jgi:outer membrane protein assembly factor BamA
MGRFSTAQVQPDPGEGEVVNVKIAVSEGASHQVTLGGGFGIDPISYEVRGRAGYVVSGFPTPLETLTLDFRPAYAYLRDGSGYEPRMRALVRLEREDLFFTYATGTAEVGYDYLAYEAYTLYGPRAELGYVARLGTRHLKLRVGYLIHRYDFTKPSPLLDAGLQMQIGIDHAETVGAFQQSLIADFRDHPLEPRLGFYAEIQVTEGTPLALGSYTYEQIVPEVRGYVPVGPVVLAARARYGAFYGGVPPTERFFGGGATSQRGFSERELAPFVHGMVNGTTINVPYGGAGLIDTSIEARFPIMTVRAMPLGGVVFLDGGDVTETTSELSLSHLNYAAGVGLRLKTVVGPVRADFGYRLNRTGPADPEPGSTFAFHLSLGEAF